MKKDRDMKVSSKTLINKDMVLIDLKMEIGQQEVLKIIDLTDNVNIFGQMEIIIKVSFLMGLGMAEE